MPKTNPQKVRTGDPIDIEVGARVKSLRMQRRMSQTDLGDRPGITFQQVQKYEKGMNRISSSRMQQIANALGVAPSYFFDNPLASVPDAQRVGIDELLQFTASKDGNDLMRAFVRVKNKSIRHSIVKMVEDLVEE